MLAEGVRDCDAVGACEPVSDGDRVAESDCEAVREGVREVDGVVVSVAVLVPDVLAVRERVREDEPVPVCVSDCEGEALCDADSDGDASCV